MSMTLNQQRASYCMERIGEVKNGKYLEDYCKLIKGFPGVVLTNGLGQALAMLLAKGGRSEMALHDQVQTWLCKKCPARPYSPPQETNQEASRILSAMMNGDQDLYVAAQSETHALLGWMKKLALAAKTLQLAEKGGEQAGEDTARAGEDRELEDG